MIFRLQAPDLRLKWAFGSCKNGAWGDEPDGVDDAVCIRAADFNADLGKMIDAERTVRAIDEPTYRKIGLRAGDLIVEKSGGGEKQLVGRSVLYRGSGRAVCSNFLARCRPSELATSEYLNYLMLGIYKARGTYPHIKQTTGIQNLDMASLLNIRVRLPALEIQSRIVEFLDEKTGQIDGLISHKQVLLQRLAEKRQAIVTQAVTQGLDPAAAMKDSGIEWLGSIPAHWEVKRLKYISPRVTVGIVVTPAAYYDDEGVLALRGLNVRTMDFDLTDTRNITEEGHRINRKSELRGGDLVAVRTGAPGTTAVVPPGLAGCNCIDLVIIRRSEQADSNYIGWYLNSDVAKAQYAMGAEGALQQHFNVETSKQVLVPLPPLGEQTDIASYIQNAISAHDRQSDMVTESVAKLAEYRSALITSAVTGQIEALT